MNTLYKILKNNTKYETLKKWGRKRQCNTFIFLYKYRYWISNTLHQMH